MLGCHGASGLALWRAAAVLQGRPPRRPPRLQQQQQHQTELSCAAHARRKTLRSTLSTRTHQKTHWVSPSALQSPTTLDLSTGRRLLRPKETAHQLLDCGGTEGFSLPLPCLYEESVPRSSHSRHRNPTSPPALDHAPHSAPHRQPCLASPYLRGRTRPSRSWRRRRPPWPRRAPPPPSPAAPRQAPPAAAWRGPAGVQGASHRGLSTRAKEL